MAPALGRAPGRRRRPRWLAAVFLLVLIVPILEIAAIIAVGKVIGGWPTFGLLVLESALGAWLVRREGSRAWAALRDALATGRMPSRQLADAALVLVGGTLLLTPGFLTDVVGFFLILPFTRPLARSVLQAAVARRLLGGMLDGHGRGGRPGGAGRSGRSGDGRGGDGPDVIEGEVL